MSEYLTLDKWHDLIRQHGNDAYKHVEWLFKPTGEWSSDFKGNYEVNLFITDRIELARSDWDELRIKQ